MTRIDEVGLPAHAEGLSNEELDALPFGVIRLDPAGKIV